MRKTSVWLGFAATLLLALVVMDSSDAQPGKGPPFGKKGPRRVTADQIVERLLSFDKNSDGKITAEELPERMQHLIALGDVNKDGALDKEEVRKLATTLEAFVEFVGPAVPGGPLAPGAAGPRGKGILPKGPAFRAPALEIQRTLDDLEVSGMARAKADRALRLHQEKIRRFQELSRAELILQMKDILNEEDYKAFKTALDRPLGPPRAKGPLTANLNARIKQLQKELDELRHKLPKTTPREEK
jgi:hypothetical protein